MIVRVGRACGDRVLGVATPVDVEPYGSCGQRLGLRPEPVGDLDVDLLVDRALVDEVVDEDPGGRVVLVAKRRRQVQVRALVSGREKALPDSTL